MSDKLYKLNLLYAITDTIVCIIAVAAFSLAGWIFGRWWILLFNFVPLILFNNHALIIDSALDELREDAKLEEER